mgnify:CR=1 FL=1
MTNALTALASTANLDHPLLEERENPRRAGVLVVTSDRAWPAGYNANVLRTTNELVELLRSEGQGSRHLRHRPKGRELLLVPQATHRR